MLTTTANQVGTRVVLGPVRLSYTHLFTKYKGMGDGDGKYQTNILISKDDHKAVNAINAAIEAAKAEATASKWGGVAPKKFVHPALRDGDDKGADGYDDHFYLVAKANNQPTVVDRNKQPIFDPEEVYSGVWAFVSVNFYGYASNGNKGIGCGLNSVMKFKDDTRFGGGGGDDFAGIELGFTADDDL